MIVRIMPHTFRMPARLHVLEVPKESRVLSVAEAPGVGITVYTEEPIGAVTGPDQRDTGLVKRRVVVAAIQATHLNNSGMAFIGTARAKWDGIMSTCFVYVEEDGHGP